MRLQVARLNWLLLLLIDSIKYGMTENSNKRLDFTRNFSGRGNSNSLMDTMMKKYSYPKNEVTAGVGYGHHLHPFYYRGEKEIMYPCAVECGEWELVMDSDDDNANDASSNVDVVTVRPDVSTIDITTPNSRPYKDISLFRPKKYRSNVFLSGSTPAPTSTKTSSKNNDLSHQDSKGADVKIIPQKLNNDDKYVEENDAKHQTTNDDSLYAKYHSALVNGYGDKLNADENTEENKNNEYFDPAEASISYNPPSFNDDDNDDIEAPVYPTVNKFHPKRERIEEKYVKHNVREERLEDVRTNSFGPSAEEDGDYPTDSHDDGKNPPKYIDDYAAPRPHNPFLPSKNYQDEYDDESPESEGIKPFRPSPLQVGTGHPPIRNRHHPLQEPNGQSRPYYDPKNQVTPQDDYDYSDYYPGQDENYNNPSNKLIGGYYRPINPRGKPRGRNYGKKYPYARIPYSKRVPNLHGRHVKYPLTYNGHQLKQNSYSENYYPYAPRHGYPPRSQRNSVRLKPGGIRVVEPPRRPYPPPPHGRYPLYKMEPVFPVKNNRPYVGGHDISYRKIIPQKDGFTKVIKKYRSFTNHIPKRYVVSG